MKVWPLNGARNRAVCTKGSLWEGAVSQRLTEGESPGFFDAVSYEALVIDQRSLPQSASRPAPSQREPLVHTAKLPFRKAVGQSREAHCDYPTKVAPPLQTVLKAWAMDSVVADSAKVELTIKNITTSP